MVLSLARNTVLWWNTKTMHFQANGVEVLHEVKYRNNCCVWDENKLRDYNLQYVFTELTSTTKFNNFIDFLLFMWQIIYYYCNRLHTYHKYTFVKFILNFPRPYFVLFTKYRCIVNLCIPYTITVFLYSMIFDYIICTFVLVYNVYRWSFVCYVSKI